MRARYQHGTLTKAPRKSGDVWEYRYRETAGSKRVQRTIVVGAVAQLKTEAAAMRAVESIRINLNNGSGTCGSAMRFDVLAEHYQDTELPLKAENDKSFSTKKRTRGYIKKWITPAWSSTRISDLGTIAIENWLRGLSLGSGSRAKIRNIMSAMFRHAMRHGFINENPVRLVRQSSKRRRIPDVLTIEELKMILSKLRIRERTMVLLDAGSGMRRGELFGLKWGDVDFAGNSVWIRRSVVEQHVGPVKTEASMKQMPLDEYTIKQLVAWYAETPYKGDDHFVFATDSNRAGDKRGKQPCWPNKVWDYWIRPRILECGISKQVNWHTFRHTFSTLLKANGEDIKTVQELLRHSSSRVTLDVYTQAVDQTKRDAQSKIVRLFAAGEA